MSNNKISVIVPCYNQETFLDETLRSVQSQTFTNWECILINDGSTDNTAEICKKWLQRDARFHYIYTDNKGVSNARNLGLEKAEGDFIQFLDADDKMDFRNFEKKIAISEKAQIILGEFNILKKNQYLPGYNTLKIEYLDFETLLFGWETQFTIPIHAALISRELLKNFSFNTSLMCFEDYLMWLHIAEQKPVCKFVDEPLVFYRKEDRLKSASSDLTKLVNEKIKLLPIIKSTYGEIVYDQYVCNLIKSKSLENLNQKKYIRQLQNMKVLKCYLSFKRLLSKFHR